jgi:hypothetical protein
VKKNRQNEMKLVDEARMCAGGQGGDWDARSDVIAAAMAKLGGKRADGKVLSEKAKARLG